MYYDATNEHNETKYEDFIEWLIVQTVERIRSGSIENGVGWYLETAYSASLSGGEVVDFFCVSSDLVCDRLGRQSDMDKKVIECFDHLNPAAFGRRYGTK